MKLTNKERHALNLLRQLDAQQRDKLLAKLERAVLANRITARAGALKKVSPVPDHKIVRAFGTVPPYTLKVRKP